MPKISFDPAFNLGEVVYLVTDPDQFKRIVVGYNYKISGIVTFTLAFLEKETNHYQCEVSRDKFTENKPIGFKKS